MPHLLVNQITFVHSELVRSMEGVTADAAVRRTGPMNSLSWIVGHLADQEQRYFLTSQGLAMVAPDLNDLVGFGKPATTPPLDEMWVVWKAITAATAPVLTAMANDDLLTLPPMDGPRGESNGTLLLRVITHNWFHIGEGQAIRQMLGHTKLPVFVGPIGEIAPFRVE